MYSGPKTYKLIRKMKIIQLPHPDTVRSYIRSFRCEPGLGLEMFMLLKLKLDSMQNPLNRILCLTFDEMDVSSQMRFNIMSVDILFMITLYLQLQQALGQTLSSQFEEGSGGTNQGTP